MNVIRCTIQKERFVLVRLYEFNGMGNNAVCYVFVFPQSLSSAFHIAYATDAVYDRLVVSVAWLKIIQQFWVVFPCGNAGKRLAVTYFYWGGSVVIGHFSVLYINAGHPVGCCSHYVGVAESYVRQVRTYLFVPVLFSGLVSEAQMPFADGTRCISVVFKQVSYRILFRTYNHACITGRNSRVFSSPRVMACQERISRRGAGCSHCMSISKAHAAIGQPVHIRCADRVAAIAAQVPIA